MPLRCRICGDKMLIHGRQVNHYSTQMSEYDHGNICATVEENLKKYRTTSLLRKYLSL